jgi:hypothetical protein
MVVVVGGLQRAADWAKGGLGCDTGERAASGVATPLTPCFNVAARDGDAWNDGKDKGGGGGKRAHRQPPGSP